LSNAIHQAVNLDGRRAEPSAIARGRSTHWLQFGYSGGSCSRCDVQRPRPAMPLCDYFASAASAAFPATDPPAGDACAEAGAAIGRYTLNSHDAGPPLQRLAIWFRGRRGSTRPARPRFHFCFGLRSLLSPRCSIQARARRAAYPSEPTCSTLSVHWPPGMSRHPQIHGAVNRIPPAAY